MSTIRSPARDKRGRSPSLHASMKQKRGVARLLKRKSSSASLKTASKPVKTPKDALTWGAPVSSPAFIFPQTAGAPRQRSIGQGEVDQSLSEAQFNSNRKLPIGNPSSGVVPRIGSINIAPFCSIGGKKSQNYSWTAIGTPVRKAKVGPYGQL